MEEKTPKQLMDDFKLGKPTFIDRKPQPPDYHSMALLAAQTLPNQSIDELLSNAEKIEQWLMAPEVERQEMSRKVTEAVREWGVENKKTPAFVGVLKSIND